MSTETAAVGNVAQLYRYPVKGLSPEALESVQLEPGETIPYDRAYAIENGPGRFDPHAPKYLPKINFLMLMRDERLATLRTQFDDTSETLTVFRDGKQVAKGQLGTPIGRSLIEQFFASYMRKELRGAPRIVAAAGHSFSDVPVKCLHVVNLATVRELERTVGRPVDPLRFRANIYLDGFAAWEENRWIGKELSIGDTRFSVLERTTRCEATNVDPATGARDLSIPSILQRQWGHTDFGIYMRTVGAGSVRVGNEVSVAT